MAHPPNANRIHGWGVENRRFEVIRKNQNPKDQRPESPPFRKHKTRKDGAPGELTLL
jgi:hypothetical protein